MLFLKQPPDVTLLSSQRLKTCQVKKGNKSHFCNYFYSKNALKQRL